MALEDVKERIAPVEAQALAAAITASGDTVRGWWRCVGRAGLVYTASMCLTDISAGLKHADDLANEGVAAVIVQHPHDIETTTRALAGLLCNVDASQVTPRNDSDLIWMQQCADVRDQQTVMRDQLGRALDIADGDIAGTAALLLGLAARRTPVLLIGVHAHAAALLAQRQSVAAVSWWRSAVSDIDPVVLRAQERLQLDPWLRIGTLVTADVSEDITATIVRSLQA